MAKRILIVDDSQAELSLFEMMISAGSDYEVILARDGKEAIELFLKEQFDLVLTDLYMPNMNGIMLVKEIRKHNKHIPVIGCSGAFFDDDDDEIQDMEFTELLHKPFREKELTDLLAKHLNH